LGNSKNGSSPGISSRAIAFVMYIYINDLTMIINHVTDVLFADDTSVLIMDKNYED